MLMLFFVADIDVINNSCKCFTLVQEVVVKEFALHENPVYLKQEHVAVSQTCQA